MFKFFLIIFFPCIVLLVINGCAAGIVKERMEITVDPHRSYEECVELRATSILDYSFTASKPVNFNIHYHAEGGIFYPVSENNVSVSKGEFSTEKEKHYSKEQEYFCMMWENPHAEHVNLTCTYKVQSK